MAPRAMRRTVPLMLGLCFAGGAAVAAAASAKFGEGARQQLMESTAKANAVDAKVLSGVTILDEEPVRKREAKAAAEEANSADEVVFGSAVGDPHLISFDGEKFDVNMVGEHVLVKIPPETGDDFEIMGQIVRFPRNGKECRFFFRSFKLRGAWLGDKDSPITIMVGSHGNLSGFGYEHGPAEARTLEEFSALAKSGPKRAGATVMTACTEDADESNRILCSELSEKNPDERKLLLTPALSPAPLNVLISRRESADPAYLNINFAGLALTKATVGGLLGKDPHWLEEAMPEHCPGADKSKAQYIRGLALFRKHKMFPLIVGNIA